MGSVFGREYLFNGPGPLNKKKIHIPRANMESVNESFRPLRNGISKKGDLPKNPLLSISKESGISPPIPSNDFGPADLQFLNRMVREDLR